MSFEITNGKISYSRTLNTGDFNNKKAEVQLEFSAEPGKHTDALNTVSRLAIDKCNEMLGQASPKSGAAVVQVAASSGGDKAALAAAAQAAVSVEPTIARTPEAAPKAKKPPKPPKDAASLDDIEGATVAKPVVDAASLDDDLLGAAETEITDADIQNKIVATNGVIKNPKAIRDLIAKYVTAPKRATDIPKELRSKFFGELEQLKPAA